VPFTPVTVPPVQASGIVIAPAANAVIADSGALPAGKYVVIVHYGSTGIAAVGKGMAYEHRNAANAANIHTFTWPTPSGGRIELHYVTVALNERIRVVNATTAGEAASRYSAHIQVLRIE
jgi:hypothetical protein